MFNFLRKNKNIDIIDEDVNTFNKLVKQYELNMQNFNNADPEYIEAAILDIQSTGIKIGNIKNKISNRILKG
jgi:predicted translin family RNA/ssDNA-binding protein